MKKVILGIFALTSMTVFADILETTKFVHTESLVGETVLVSTIYGKRVGKVENANPYFVQVNICNQGQETFTLPCVVKKKIESISREVSCTANGVCKNAIVSYGNTPFRVLNAFENGDLSLYSLGEIVFVTIKSSTSRRLYRN